MIRYLRQFQSSKTVSYATFAVAISMMLWGVERLFISRASQNITHGSQMISMAERQDVMASLIAQDRKQINHLSPQEIASYQELADSVLLQELSLHGYTKALGVHLHADVLAETLKKDGAMDGIQKTLSDQRSRPDPNTLAQLQRRMQRFQRSMNQQLLMQALQESTLSTAADIDTLASVYQHQRAFSWFRIPLMSTKQESFTPDEASIEEYYHTHPFVQPAEMRVHYLRFPAKQFSASQPPSQKQLQQYYSENPGRFDTPAQYHLTTYALQDHPNEQSKKLSAEIVRQNWITPKNAPKFANKWLYYQETQQRILDKKVVEKSAVSSLKSGQYWLEQDQNGHTLLVTCTKITPAKTCTLASCPSTVKKAWGEDTTRSKRDHFVHGVKESLLFAPTDLAGLAKSHQLTVATTPPFTAAHGKGIAEDDNFRSTAFSDAVRSSSAVSDPVVLASGDVVLIQKADYSEASKQPLATARQAIVENLRSEHALKSHRQAIDSARTDLRAGKDPNQVAKRFTSKVEKSSLHDQRHTQTLPAALTQSGYQVSAHQLGWQHAQLLPDFSAQNWIVFALLDVDYHSSTADTNTQQQLNQLYQQLELGQYLDQLF